MTTSTIIANGIEDDDDSFYKPLGRRPVFIYGMGHMLNDITAACWFTYLLLFLTDIGLSPKAAAYVMLSGQVADGFATIFTGELIDRFGHFKLWHGAGSLLVDVSFSLVFGGCLPCTILSTSSLTVETGLPSQKASRGMEVVGGESAALGRVNVCRIVHGKL